MKQPQFFPITIKAAPKVGNLYWCNFHDAAHIHLPEMWKTRPVLIVSRKNFLRGKVMALPLSTEVGNTNNKFAFKMPYETSKLIDGLDTWVLCDHIVTISTSRLRQINGIVPRLKDDSLEKVLEIMISSLANKLPK